MFTYAFKNLRSLFTRQRLLGFLLLLNIVASAFVLCFSYGVYRNYDEIREREEITTDTLAIRIYMRSDSFQPMFADPDNWNYGAFTDELTPQMFTDLLRSFSDDLNKNIAGIDAQFWVKTPLSCMANYDKSLSIDDEAVYFDTGDLTYDKDNMIYTDDASEFWWPINCFFKLLDGKIVDAEDEKFFSYDQYNSGEKIVAVADILFDDNRYNNYEDHPAFMSFFNGSKHVSFFLRDIPLGTRSLMIGGERYEVVRRFRFDKIGTNKDGIKIPVTAIPDGAMIGDDEAVRGQESEAWVFTIRFKDYATDRQCKEIEDKVSEVMGKNVYPESLPHIMARESDYFNTLIVLALFIGVIASINMAILYNYILEKRSAELAIFRICGCTQERAIASYLIECLMINAPVFALSQLCYHKLVIPKLIKIFPYINGVYTSLFYISVFCIYVSVSAFIMYKMIKSAVKKHSLVTLKNAKRATNRFGIMKALEIIQFSAIISLLVVVVSTITSRYEFFEPLEQYLSRSGYMVVASDVTTSPHEFEIMTDGAECIMSRYGGVSFKDADKEFYTHFEGISYSDELIELYTPDIISGVWLSDTDETYQSSGYIPAVITENDKNYKVGDILPDDIITDEGESITDTTSARYKIVGIVGNDSKILSYIPTGLRLGKYELNNHLSMFNVFSAENERDPFLLTRISDTTACYGGDNVPVHGVQLVLCDNMSAAEYAIMWKKLSNAENLHVEELSTIYENSKLHIYEQMYSLLPVAVCIFILTLISAISINAIYTKRQLRNYAIFYICGAKWSRCALMSLKNGIMTCIASSVLAAVVLTLGKTFLFGDTVISFGMWQLAVCGAVVLLYLILSMIMPLSIIGSAQPREVLKEE